MPRSPEEHAPLGECFIQSYDQGSRDHPIVARKVDPREYGYTIPDAYATCPDPRYSDHQFVGVEPIEDDQRVYWIYRLLPGPAVTGQEVNARLGIVSTFTEQEVVADSANGDPDSDIIPNGVYVDKVRTSPSPDAALAAYQYKRTGYAPVDLPDVLTGITSVWENPEGIGFFEETGEVGAGGTTYRLDLSVSGSGEASAAVIPEILPIYAPRRGKKAPYVELYIFLQQPVEEADVLAKLPTMSYLSTAVTGISSGVVSAAGHTLAVDSPFRFRTLVGVTGSGLATGVTYYARDIVAGVSFKYATAPAGSAVTTGSATSGSMNHVIQAWPNFQEVGEHIVCKGQKVHLQARATGRFSFSMSDSEISSALSEGQGGNRDINPSIHPIVLKDAIHGEITIANHTNSATARASASCTIPASGDFVGIENDTGPLEMDANGSITPHILAATPVASIPTSGQYLEEFPMEMTEWDDWTLVCARIRDFSRF